MEEQCTQEGCTNGLRNGIAIRQKGHTVGIICEECLGSAKGAKLFIRKNSKGKFVLEEMQRLEKPL